MGTYFNPGNESFQKAVCSRIYVDKTGLLIKLNPLLRTEQNCIALSHARRFGKSQAADMIDAYYSCGCDSRELFAGRKITGSADCETHRNKYNVIHLDMSSITDFCGDNVVGETLRCLTDDFHRVYGDELNTARAIHVVLDDIYKTSGRPFVIIIDEWDCVVRNYADKPDVVHEYLQFLHALFKSRESKQFLALSWITGILPVKKIENESALNNFNEYTMLASDELTEYFGFTEDEVSGLCSEYGMPIESMKEWYDGYRISGRNMYNPNSVVTALLRNRFDSYWKNTSSFKTVNRLIEMNFDGLKDDILSMLAGGRTPVDPDGFRNDFSVIDTKDDALTALIHLGYLGWDADSKEAFIPNFEVSKAYQYALKTSGWTEVAKSISRCDELLTAAIRQNADRVAEIIEQAHDAYSSILKYNDENSLSCAVTMAFFTAPAYYNIIRELPAGKGFADFAFIPRSDTKNKPAMIVELKWNQGAETAIRQIKDRKYPESLRGYSGEVLLVGISYNKDDPDKKHSCIIESISGAPEPA